jgi:hypothetical protein
MKITHTANNEFVLTQPYVLLPEKNCAKWMADRMRDSERRADMGPTCSSCDKPIRWIRSIRWVRRPDEFEIRDPCWTFLVAEVWRCRKRSSKLQTLWAESKCSNCCVIVVFVVVSNKNYLDIQNIIAYFILIYIRQCSNWKITI